MGLQGTIDRQAQKIEVGRYRYSHCIGRGGMAQVFLATQESIGGFAKPVVIKRIFPHLCEDRRFIQMFLTEARLAASVRHPHVVEIFDIGLDDEGYFMVMEYLSGETLALVAQSLVKRSERMPVGLVCRIGADIASGLHSAHTATDAMGVPRPVVHRDVTPSNLLVCYNGAVKIVDFGVAKALAENEETKGYPLKGKLAYLAPEQVLHQPVDARTDIFQLGIVLHELLVGRRLFAAPSEHGKIQAVMDREIEPPSALNPLVPARIDEIVLHMLQRDPDQRPASADKVRSLLDEAMADMGEVVTDHAIGAWMQRTFAEHHAARLAMERTAAREAEGSREIKIPAPEILPAPRMGQDISSVTPSIHGQALENTLHVMARANQAGAATGNAPAQDEPMEEDAEALEPDIEMEQSTVTGVAARAMGLRMSQARVDAVVVDTPPPPPRREPDRRPRHQIAAIAWLRALLLIAALVGIALFASRIPHARIQQPTSQSAVGLAEQPAVESAAELAGQPAVDAATRTYSLALQVFPSHASIELDGVIAGTGLLVTELPRDRSMHLLVIRAPGYEPRMIPFSATRQPWPFIRLRPLVSPAAPAGLDLVDNRSPATQPVTKRSAGTQSVRKPPNDAQSDAQTLSSPPPDASEPPAFPDTPRTDNIDPWTK